MFRISVRFIRKVGEKKSGEKVKTKKWGLSKKKKIGREVGILRKIPFFP